MEISKTLIARLVLGYLKSEDCTGAFEQFLTTSKYLERHAPFVKNGKYFSTRVGGLTLEDIINEYSEISFLVEGKLEQTNYYEEHHKMNLVNQLLYIFDNYCQQQPVTPILANSLNATPKESLPGNSPCKDSSKDASSTFEGGSLIEPGNISQISQALLDKSELHEKLADAINSVCKTSQEEDSQGKSAFAELDNKIKTIVQKAEQDPIFDQILDEIIGTNNVPTTDSPCSINLDTPRSSHSLNNQIGESPQRVKNGADEEISLNNISGTNYLTTNTSTPKVDPEVIVFSGNLDSYVNNAGALVKPQQQNQIYLAATASNPAGLLMLPSMITPNYFILNNQLNSSGIVTDNDIMKMPTIILNDAPSIKATKEIPSQTILKTLAPKCESITVSTQCGDYLAVYKDDGDVIVKNAKEQLPKKKQSAKPRRETGLRKQLPRQAKIKTNTTVEVDQQATPPTQTNTQKTTPRSGSHIRTLNFNTPPKDDEQTKSEKIEIKKKNSSKTLFRNEMKDGVRKDMKASQSSWDADLRELLIPNKISIQSPDTSSDQLNLTCEDDPELENNAKLIEAAFQSPVKINTPNKDHPKNNIDDDIPTKNTNEEEKTEKEKPDDSLDSKELKVSEEAALAEKVTVEETELYLRNCNGPQRFKRKCNITNNMVPKYEVDVVIETEQIVDETMEDFRESKNNEATFGKRDLILETPVKSVPKTPGKCELTPFSKALEEHLQGMDLLAMPTPNLPITPSYPITPSIALNTPLHINRPTDYSTSSSYYQPSDTEQNKSLELMIEECKKLEKRDNECHNTEILDENMILSEKSTVISNLNEMKRAFNENAVGKKNLSLIKSRNSSSSESQDSNSSNSTSSNSDSDSDSEYDPKEERGSVVIKESYCLRNRNLTPKTDNGNRSISSRKTPSKASDKNVVDNKYEQSTSKHKAKSIQKVTVRERSVRIIKKSIPRKRIGTLNEKHSVKPNDPISKILEAENEITDEDITLHLSTDEESINRPSTDNPKMKEVASEKIFDKDTPSDFEAELLVQGLKERGIHLVHKKSPKKSSDEIEEELQNEKDPKTEMNQIIVKNEELENDKNEVEILSSKSSASIIDTINNDSTIIFDIKCFETEHVKLEYNYSKRKPRKKNTDMKISGKKMKATVYIEALDTEVERVIEYTPFESIFDFIPKNNSNRKSKCVMNSDRSKRKAIESPKKTNKAKSNQNKLKENTDCSKKNQENTNKKHCKEDVTQTNSRIDQERAESMKSVEKKPNKVRNISDSKNTKKGEVEKSKKPMKQIDLKDDAKSRTSETNAKDVSVILGTKVSGHANRTLEEEKFVNPSDDELMNYAVIGSQREETPTSPKSGDKRKHSTSEEVEPDSKKCKTEQQQALLKKINVDMFLNKVHGNLENQQC